MAGIVIGIVAFLLLRFAAQLIQLLLLLGILLVQVVLLLVVDGPYARARYALLFGLVLIGSALRRLCFGSPSVGRAGADAAGYC